MQMSTISIFKVSEVRKKTENSVCLSLRTCVKASGGDKIEHNIILSSIHLILSVNR